MKNFHDIKFPEYIAEAAWCAPMFDTSIATAKSGREVRILHRKHAIRHYKIENCKLSTLQFNEFNAFFLARGGSTYSFCVKDYIDHKAEKQNIGVGDGVKTKFTLVKIYNDAVESYHRRIYVPDIDSIMVYVNDHKVEFTYNNYNIVLQAIPSKGDIITADFEFYIPVRFGHDTFKYKFCRDGTIELTDLELIEVIH